MKTNKMTKMIQKKKTNRKGKGPSASKKQPTSIENEETPVNDELKLSEDDEPTKGATAKKGPTKRTAPASGKKTAVTSTKKKGQNDEPFDDHTNDEVENNIEDDPSTAKQSRKGRSAPTSASKTTNRNGGGKKNKRHIKQMINRQNKNRIYYKFFC